MLKYPINTKGWVLLEVMGSCLLLGVVLMVLNNQMQAQWLSLQHELHVQSDKQKAAELKMMRSMLKDNVWLLEADPEWPLVKESGTEETHNVIERPSCNHCRDVLLEKWFESRYP
ncbi:hypothetical protein [Marinomonas algicola]|jgi:hypothetical protein|uniref:hypothetical protein n=1 Tax=Marinomonas algicola TaxID=2773454 RepID=UPI00174D446C|nr:hypothetical protein [Marinomonas algicola]